VTIPLYTYIQGQGFPLLTLHGHPGSGRSLSVFTDYYKQRFTTLAPDLRGYGKTPAPKAFEITDHLTDLIALLDRQNIPKTLVLGWSLGGIFAMELALRYPERISGLILVGTAARPWGDHPPISNRDNLLTAIAGLINLAKPGWQWNIDTFGKRSLFRHLVQQHTPATYQFLARDAVYAFLRTSPRAHQSLNRAIGQGYNLVPDLPKIQCPALVLMGENDRHISPIASQETAKALKQAEWECYPATAHLLPWEIPGLLLPRIDQWLEAHPEVITP
jgi:pimeloyl-ACP methyl ester carboxylesterase